jgi:hypothetical protein
MLLASGGRETFGVMLAADQDDQRRRPDEVENAKQAEERAIAQSDSARADEREFSLWSDGLTIGFDHSREWLFRAGVAVILDCALDRTIHPSADPMTRRT